MLAGTVADEVQQYIVHCYKYKFCSVPRIRIRISIFKCNTSTLAGFAGKYTFVYLPIDFKTHAGLGYAFVDLVSREETAARLALSTAQHSPSKG